MNWNCTKILREYKVVNEKLVGKNVVCNKPLKKLGFHKDYFGVFRLACEKHWSI
jgi:hypothetical protein